MLHRVTGQRIEVADVLRSPSNPDEIVVVVKAYVETIDTTFGV